MSMVRFFPSRCTCGAPGYLKAALIEPVDGLEPPDRDWRFHVEPNAAPVVLPAREYRIALHEAGHAVLAHALGTPVAAVSIEGQPHVAYADASANHATTAMVALAGDHAERLLLQRLEYRPEDSDVIASFEAVRQLAFGGCDRCTTALAILGMVGAKASNDVLLGTYRDVEANTIEILRAPRVRAAIRSLAALLMSVGKVGGIEANEIIQAAGIEFGSSQITGKEATCLKS